MNSLLLHGLLCLVLFASCKSKSDDCSQCNDPAARNYAPNAPATASCCVYSQVKPEVKTELDSKVNETSGLVYSDGRIWTHNDSGGANEIYAVDSTNGSIRQTVVLTGATNVDWEDLTKSDTHLYIGDMGNNDGDRKNLRIYRFPRTALTFTAAVIQVPVETIEFSYPDQSDFTKREAHNFDCEAIIYFQDKLYLFTKNRQDFKCNLYTVPATPGQHVAQAVGNFDSRGLITGVDISASGKEVVLIGYDTNLKVFLWMLNGFKDDQFLSGKQQLVNLGSFADVGQAEAVCYTDANTLYLSNEKNQLLTNRLYRVNAASIR